MNESQHGEPIHPAHATRVAACADSGARESATEDASSPHVTRRGFLGQAIAAGAAGTALPALVGTNTAEAGQGTLTPEDRRHRAYKQRVSEARRNYLVPLANHDSNGDEDAYPDRIASYSKGLPHNAFGEVDPIAYDAFLAAVASGDPDDFEAIPSGNSDPASRFKLVSPQSGLAFDIEGTDGHQFDQPPAPAFDSAWEAGEVVENYWMALLRDVPFAEYSPNVTAQAAAADLTRLSDFRGPKQNGSVTTRTLFRESFPGCLVGPYISQFFAAAQPFGAQFVEPRIRTTVAGLDYMTQHDDWLARQNGVLPSQGNVYDPTLRYIRNGRDLGEWVHIDVLYQAYFQAMLALLHGPAADPRFSGLAAPLNPGNPYHGSANQQGFATFGGPHIATLLCEVATRALKAVWFQKWFVHRRLRPEVFAGRVHHQIVSARPYPVHADVLNAQALDEVFALHGTYFLPMAFPEGSPTHPAYGAGHATVAGACVTILKAFFDAEIPFASLAQPMVASADGLALVPYTGGDAGEMTVAGELNKLAANVAHGRNVAGVHWRTDATESLLLGEQVAISILRDHGPCFNEDFGGYTFTRFDGTQTTV